jgi:membrane protein DedA with SNARE-associated domain
MLTQSSMKMLLFLLIGGEILTTSAGILSHMSTDKIALLIVAFAGLWMIFILASVWVDNIIRG